MPMKPLDRFVESRPYKDNEEFTVPLARTNNVLTGVCIHVEGKIDLAATGTSFKIGGIARLIDRVRLVVSGFDSGLGLRVPHSVRCDIPGWMLAYTPPKTSAPQPRINFLEPKVPLSTSIANNDEFRDISPTSVAEQSFYFTLYLPFSNVGWRNPGDTALDLGQMESVDLVLQTPEDWKDAIFNGTPGSGSTINATIRVEPLEMRDADLQVAHANAIAPAAAMRHVAQPIVFTADNSEFRYRLNGTTDNIKQIALICLDEDSSGDQDADDEIIENIRYERNSVVSHDLKAFMVRRHNIRMMAMHHPNTTNGRHVLVGSGVYLFAPGAGTAFDKDLIIETPYPGVGDSTSDLILAIKKQTNNARVWVLESFIRMDNEFAAITRSQADQTIAQRAISADIIAARNQRQREVEAMAGQS